jgi:hypothetical protein
MSCPSDSALLTYDYRCHQRADIVYNLHVLARQSEAAANFALRCHRCRRLSDAGCSYTSKYNFFAFQHLEFFSQNSRCIVLVFLSKDHACTVLTVQLCALTKYWKQITDRDVNYYPDDALFTTQFIACKIKLRFTNASLFRADVVRMLAHPSAFAAAGGPM